MSHMRLPPPNDPAWVALIEGNAPIEPTFLAAKMFIVRSRVELASSGHSTDVLRKVTFDLRELYLQNTASPSARRDLAALFE